MVDSPQPSSVPAPKRSISLSRAIIFVLTMMNVCYFCSVWIFPIISLTAIPAKLDVGDVTQKPLVKTLHVQNTGNRLVWLEEPVPTCTCTQVELPTRKLWPGQKVELTAHFRSGPTDGPISNFVNIPYTCSGQRRELQIRMVGRVTSHVGIEPTSGVVDFVSGQPLSFVCQSRYSPGIKVVQAYCTHSSVDVAYEQVDEKTVSISVAPNSNIPEKTSKIDRPAKLIVVTNSEWTPIIRIPLRVSFQGALSKQ